MMDKLQQLPPTLQLVQLMVEGRHHVAGQLVIRRVQVHLLVVTLILIHTMVHVLMI